MKDDDEMIEAHTAHTTINLWIDRARELEQLAREAATLIEIASMSRPDLAYTDWLERYQIVVEGRELPGVQVLSVEREKKEEKKTDAAPETDTPYSQ